MAIATLALSLCGVAQKPQSFEVASIHPVTAPIRNTSFDMFEGGRLRVSSVTVYSLIKAAWLIQSSQVAGGPDWLNVDRYDIDAKSGTPGRIGKEALKELLQSLLADRFALRVHWETREQPAYALMTGKNGAKLTENHDAAFTTLNSSHGFGNVRVYGTKVTMTQLAGYIGDEIGRIVVDKTDLSGGYDLTLEWDPEPSADSSRPSIFAALQEQLGLRLESRKAPVQVLVVDSVQKASEN
jgi:uncharacterized protein (TIGR03435 family)